MKVKNEQVFWMVWRESSGHCRMRHLSKAKAQAEAERLATLNPHHKFFVLKAVGGAYGDVPKLKRIKPTKNFVSPYDEYNLPF